MRGAGGRGLRGRPLRHGPLGRRGGHRQREHGRHRHARVRRPGRLHPGRLHGQGPGGHGCSRDGQTLALIHNEEMVIELRYSRACGAAWGRITYAKPEAVVDVNDSEGTSETSPVHWGNDVYSPMTELSGTRTAWACGTQPDGKSRACTVHSPVPAAH
ncbi:DUF2690 domain-containing protein [Streptomyces sp. SID625]|nr:DUF2690 domain-containing protein [Streptomyces sp. SID625]